MGIQSVGPLNSGAAVGGNGVATANTSSASIITGRLLAVQVKYNGSPPATTDVPVATTGSRHPAETLLTLANANTDTTKYPRAAQSDTAGAAVTFDGTHAIVDALPIDDYVNIKIDQANAGQSVDVWLLVSAP